jgi:hypothetical protein
MRVYVNETKVYRVGRSFTKHLVRLTNSGVPGERYYGGGDVGFAVD